MGPYFNATVAIGLAFTAGMEAASRANVGWIIIIAILCTLNMFAALHPKDKA